jgi:menaquinone-dependent protoporphyrinogen IX oxidase
MAVLVAYASKHGSTQGIAKRIAEQLRQLGKEAEARLWRPSRSWQLRGPHDRQRRLLWVLG